MAGRVGSTPTTPGPALPPPKAPPTPNSRPRRRLPLTCGLLHPSLLPPSCRQHHRPVCLSVARASEKRTAAEHSVVSSDCPVQCTRAYICLAALQQHQQEPPALLDLIWSRTCRVYTSLLSPCQPRCTHAERADREACDCAGPLPTRTAPQATCFVRLFTHQRPRSLRRRRASSSDLPFYPDLVLAHRHFALHPVALTEPALYSTV